MLNLITTRLPNAISASATVMSSQCWTVGRSVGRSECLLLSAVGGVTADVGSICIVTWRAQWCGAKRRAEAIYSVRLRLFTAHCPLSPLLCLSARPCISSSFGFLFLLLYLICSIHHHSVIWLGPFACFPSSHNGLPNDHLDLSFSLLLIRCPLVSLYRVTTSVSLQLVAVGALQFT